MLQPDYFPLGSLDELMADSSIVAVVMRPFSTVDADDAPSHALVLVDDVLRERIRAALAWMAGSGALGVDYRVAVLQGPESATSLDPLDALAIEDAVAAGEWVALRERALALWGEVGAKEGEAAQARFQVGAAGVTLLLPHADETLQSTSLGSHVLEEAA